jgi:hypothetical protein
MNGSSRTWSRSFDTRSVDRFRPVPPSQNRLAECFVTFLPNFQRRFNTIGAPAIHGRHGARKLLLNCYGFSPAKWATPPSRRYSGQFGIAYA